MNQLTTGLAALRDKINDFGKENLEEMLHALAEGIRLLAGRERVRIYLEDLTRGALACAYASGPFAADIKRVTFPIISADAVVSSVFASQYPADFRASATQGLSLDRDFTNRFAITASVLLPITSLGKSIGVACVDQERSGEVLSGRVVDSSSPFS